MAGCTALGAVLVLLGWSLDNPYLKSVVPGLVPMNPASAVLLLLAAVTLACDAATRSAPWRWILPGVSVTIVLSGGAKLLAYSTSWDAGLDRTLFASLLGENQMAPNTAADFVMLGLALFALTVRNRGLYLTSQVLAVLVLAGAVTSLVGYGFGTRSFYGIGSYIPMAFNTAVFFTLLAVGVLAARPERGISALLTGPHLGSVVARRLLPAAIAIPCIFGFLRVTGQRAGLYDTEFGAALMVVLTVALLAGAILVTAKALDRAHVERELAAELLRNAHVELRSQTEIFRLILDSMGDGVIVADTAGKFMLFNPAAERILSRGPSDATSDKWTQLYGCYLTDRVTPYPADQLPLARALRGETVDEEELFIRHDDQAHGAWISITGRPLREANGALAGGAIVFRDVTDRKRAEEALIDANEQLERRVVERTKELADANRDLTQKNQENEMFVYSVSHDLRTPLVSLQGFSKELSLVNKEMHQVLADASVPESIRLKASNLLDGSMQESLRFIQAAVTRLSSIIDALLRLSRVGRVEYQFKHVDVQSVVTGIVESTGTSFFDHSVAIKVHELDACHGDQTAVEQLFANLIGNAVKYLDPRRAGLIEIGMVDAARESLTDSGGEYRTYYVRDNGVGIPAAHQDKIFQIFKRVHPHVASGEGMGLAIARRIVERHGGQVWVESISEEGSTFFITLPAGDPSGPTASPEHGGSLHVNGTYGDLACGRR